MEIYFTENIKGVIPKNKVTLDELSNKVLIFLKSLNQIDEKLFSDWYEQGWSKKEALKKKVSLEKEYIRKIIENEWDKKFPDLGSGFTFWTGKDDDMKNSRISFTIGLITKNEYLNNIVSLSLPKSDELKINKNDERIKKIEKLIRDVWDSTEIEVSYI